MNSLTVVKNTKTSWKLTKKLLDIESLFSSYEDLNYEVELYTCICGHNEYVIKREKQEVEYICKECDNKNFFNANYSWDDPYIYDVDQLVRVKKTDSEIIAEYYIPNKPTSFSIVENKVFYKDKVICTLVLSFDGGIKEQSNYYNKATFHRLEDTIFKNTTLDITIKALNIVSNNRREKSVKRSVYKNHELQIRFGKSYNFKLVSLFTSKIEDPNILSSILDLNLESFLVLYRINVDLFIKFLCLLLEKDYTDKKLLKVLKSINDEKILKDTLDFIESNETLEEVNFTSSSLQGIHDEFIFQKYFFKPEVYRKFEYTEIEKKCTNYKIFDVRLPNNSNELYDWAKSLRNCMSYYSEFIYSKKTLIYGFFNKDNISFAVEVADNTIIEASGYKNNNLKKTEYKALKKWHEEYSINT